MAGEHDATVGLYIIITVEDDLRVVGVMTQGHGGADEWTTRILIYASYDGLAWWPVVSSGCQEDCGPSFVSSDGECDGESLACVAL